MLDTWKHSQNGETKYKLETSQPKSFKIYKNIDKITEL